MVDGKLTHDLSKLLHYDSENYTMFRKVKHTHSLMKYLDLLIKILLETI